MKNLTDFSKTVETVWIRACKDEVFFLFLN